MIMADQMAHRDPRNGAHADPSLIRPRCKRTDAHTVGECINFDDIPRSRDSRGEIAIHRGDIPETEQRLLYGDR